MQIDEPAIDAAAAESGFTGVVAIDGGDQRLFERCCGFANRAAGVPNTADTRFALASGSKTFTALAVWKPTDYVLTVPVHELAETSGFLPMLAGRPQKYAPGERFGYCNQGFVVLALIVRRRRSAAVQGANELSAEERERLAKLLEKEQTHD